MSDWKAFWLVMTLIVLNLIQGVYVIARLGNDEFFIFTTMFSFFCFGYLECRLIEKPLPEPPKIPSETGGKS